MIKDEDVNISKTASRFWTKKLKDPYTYKHRGPVSLKFQKKHILSERQAAIFENSLTYSIENILKNSNGYIKISLNDDLVIKAAERAKLTNFPEDYFKENDSMFIEENEIYFYEHGMNGSYKIY